jgi:D-alanyl-lipoteichoic acid acyltransferase DltB (MBOAT superfamily)
VVETSIHPRQSDPSNPTASRSRTSHNPPLHQTFQPVSEAEPRLKWYTRLDQGRPKHARKDLRAFVSVWIYLTLLTAVAHIYRVEGRAFEIVLWTTLAALPVYELVPFRLKKPTLSLAAIIGMACIYGRDTAICVLGFTTAMVALARTSRLAWEIRAGTLAAIAVSLAIVKSYGGLGDLPPTFWPVAGTMLMFRLMLYMYELKHAKTKETLTDAASYFLILPNWCFLHFPVVDYRTLQRGFFSKDIVETRRRGLHMMFVGTTHLLAYRLVYHELLIRPQDVRGLATLGSYLACNYLLYLRVSGQFHIACGVLHLFGHHMPDTHNKYLLAHSFTDYWRRINIYWKDFMVKTVFNPVFFRLRKRPQNVALAGATVAVFVATWALHAWQSFWLRGHWGFSVTDAMFWGILGGMVLVNVQLDARRKPTAKVATTGVIAQARYVASICGMILSITLLWSLWSSPSVMDWFSMMRRGLSGW